jgi:signal transduction histidine kinase
MASRWPILGILILSFDVRIPGFSPDIHRCWQDLSIALGTSSLFRINLPSLRSLSAALCCFAAVFLLAWFAYRWKKPGVDESLRVHRQRASSARARTAHDLHDRLLQTIEASKMIVDDALDAPEDPVRMSRTMRRLADWLGRATEEGRQVLTLLETSPCDGNDLASSFCRTAENCRLEKPMEFAIAVLGPGFELTPATRNAVYSIGLEAISNACKQPGETRLEFTLLYAAEFCLRVRFSGQVSKESDGNRGVFDLDGIEERAQQFGGTVSSTASASSTIEFTLTVPAGS